MGRQQYLARLALGRSPFAEADEDDLANDEQRPAEATDEPSAPEPYQQQYDSKGRPVNAATEERNTALRNAQNAALALTGIVEKKDNTDRLNELRYSKIRDERELVLLAEQDAGETLEILVTFLLFLDYGTETLIRRVQAGIYSSTTSFASIISGSLAAIRNTGLGGALAILFPGAPAALANAVIRVLLGASLSTGVEYFSRWLIKQKMRKRTLMRIHRALFFGCEALLIGLDVALLPLEYYAFAQRLGLAPTWPLLPSWTILLPSHPASIHDFGWRSPISIPILHHLCSPAALMLLQSSLWREQDSEIPVGSQLTKFEYPENFNAPAWTVDPPLFPFQDPFGWVLYQGFVLRTKMMQFFGYTLIPGTASPTKYESNCLPKTPPEIDESADVLSSDFEDEGVDGMRHFWRSTELANLAPRFLAQRIDSGYAKFLLLPLQALVVRSVAQSYITSSLPKTPFALSAASHLYRPFGSASPLGLLRAGGWVEMGRYLSKLGLSLGLHVANSVGIFFMVSKLVRWQGRRYFDWGSVGTIGMLRYPIEPEEDWER